MFLNETFEYQYTPSDPTDEQFPIAGETLPTNNLDSSDTSTNLPCDQQQPNSPQVRKSKKAKFSKEEDARLIKLVAEYGENEWSTIAKKMNNRNSRQCRERWKNYMNPNLSQEQWTPCEDFVLMRRFSEIGPHWNIIAQGFPHRSINCVRNRVIKIHRRSMNYSQQSIKSTKKGSKQQQQQQQQQQNIIAQSACFTPPQPQQTFQQQGFFQLSVQQQQQQQQQQQLFSIQQQELLQQQQQQMLLTQELYQQKQHELYQQQQDAYLHQQQQESFLQQQQQQQQQQKMILYQQQQILMQQQQQNLMQKATGQKIQNKKPIQPQKPQIKQPNNKSIFTMKTSPNRQTTTDDIIFPTVFPSQKWNDEDDDEGTGSEGVPSREIIDIFSNPLDDIDVLIQFS